MDRHPRVREILRPVLEAPNGGVFSPSPATPVEYRSTLDGWVDSEDVRSCSRPDALHDAGGYSWPVRHSQHSSVLAAREPQGTDGP